MNYSKCMKSYVECNITMSYTAGMITPCSVAHSGLGQIWKCPFPGTPYLATLACEVNGVLL